MCWGEIMKYKFILLIITCALIFAGCSSAGSSTSSGSSDTSTDSSAASVVSTAQMKALAKISNVSTKHTSKNGASGLGVFRNLKSSIQPLNHSNSCKKYEYGENFSGSVTETVIDCEQTLDLTAFNDSDMQNFETDQILVSKQGNKHMAYYFNERLHDLQCVTTTDWCYSMWVVDTGFYGESYYNSGSTPIANTGSLFYDIHNKEHMYFKTFIWSEASGNVDLTNIMAPKIPTGSTTIHLGSKDRPCTIGLEPAGQYCPLFIGVYNWEDKKYEKFITHFDHSLSFPSDEESGGLAMDIFHFNSDEYDKATDKNSYYANTVMALCPNHIATKNAKDILYYKNKVAYLYLSHTDGQFAIKSLASDFNKDQKGVDLKETDDPPTITIDNFLGTDCKRMPTSNASS